MKNNKNKENVKKENIIIDDEFLDVADAILTTIDNYRAFTIKPVKPTAYAKLKMKDLVQMFEDENFYKFSKKQICEICTELVTRLSRQISSIPSVVKPNKNPDMNYLMFTESKTNKIDINFEEFSKRCADGHPFLKPENVGIHYLHSIMHELYHTLQNYNFYKFLEGMPYEKDTICSTIQDVLSGTYLMEFEDEEDTMTLYDADLDELNANIFAAKMMDKFIEKDYFKDPKAVERISKYINALVCDNYSKEAINFSKQCYLSNKKALSKVKYLENKDLVSDDPAANGLVLLNEEEIMVLKSVYDFVSGLDMRKYQAKMLDEVIKYEQEFSAYALGKTDEELGFIDDEQDKIEQDTDNKKENEQINAQEK